MCYKGNLYCGVLRHSFPKARVIFKIVNNQYGMGIQTFRMDASLHWCGCTHVYRLDVTPAERRSHLRWEVSCSWVLGQSLLAFPPYP